MSLLRSVERSVDTPFEYLDECFRRDDLKAAIGIYLMYEEYQSDIVFRIRDWLIDRSSLLIREGCGVFFLDLVLSRAALFNLLKGNEMRRLLAEFSGYILYRSSFDGGSVNLAKEIDRFEETKRLVNSIRVLVNNGSYELFGSYLLELLDVCSVYDLDGIDVNIFLGSLEEFLSSFDESVGVDEGLVKVVENLLENPLVEKFEGLSICLKSLLKAGEVKGEDNFLEKAFEVSLKFKDLLPDIEVVNGLMNKCNGDINVVTIGLLRAQLTSVVGQDLTSKEQRFLWEKVLSSRVEVCDFYALVEAWRGMDDLDMYKPIYVDILKVFLGYFVLSGASFEREIVFVLTELKQLYGESFVMKWVVDKIGYTDVDFDEVLKFARECDSVPAEISVFLMRLKSNFAVLGKWGCLG